MLEDLDHFTDFAACHGEWPVVASTLDCDYGYRLTASREIFAAYLADHMGALKYPNFKNEVAKADQGRAHVYSRVWKVLRDLRSIGRKPEEDR